jgi:hypothetical protein
MTTFLDVSHDGTATAAARDFGVGGGGVAALSSNPLLHGDRHLVLSPGHPSLDEEIVRVRREAQAAVAAGTQAAVGGVGGVPAPIAGETLDDITAHWTAIKQSFARSSASVFAAKLRLLHARRRGGDASAAANAASKMRELQTQLEAMVTEWRAHLHALRRARSAVNDELTRGEHDRRVVADNIEKAAVAAATSATPAGRSTVAVHTRVTDGLRRARHEQIDLVTKADRAEFEGHTSALAGVVFGGSEFLRQLGTGLASAKTDHDRVTARISKGSVTATTAWAKKCAQLKTEFMDGVYGPLLQELNRRGIAPSVVNTAVRVYDEETSVGSTDGDPYCVNRCAVAESVLSNLLRTGSGTDATDSSDNPQDAALLRGRARMNDIEVECQKLHRTAHDAMLNHDDAPPAVMAAKLKDVNFREKALRAELATIADRVRGLSTTAPKSSSNAAALRDRATKALRVCRDVRNGVEAARQSEHDLVHAAGDQLRATNQALLDAALDRVRRAVVFADVAGRETDAVVALNRDLAAEAGRNVNVLEAARASQSLHGVVTPSETALLALLEESSHRDSAAHDSRLHRTHIVSMQRHAEWIVATGARLAAAATVRDR